MCKFTSRYQVSLLMLLDCYWLILYLVFVSLCFSQNRMSVSTICKFSKNVNLSALLCIWTQNAENKVLFALIFKWFIYETFTYVWQAFCMCCSIVSFDIFSLIWTGGWGILHKGNSWVSIQLINACLGYANNKSMVGNTWKPASVP